MIIVDEKRRSMGSAPPMSIHIQHKAEGGEIEDDVGEDHHMLAVEILEAIASKDPMALADSLYAFFEKCDEDEEGPEQEMAE